MGSTAPLAKVSADGYQRSSYIRGLAFHILARNIIDTSLINTRAVEGMPANNEQTAVHQNAMAGEEVYVLALDVFRLCCGGTALVSGGILEEGLGELLVELIELFGFGVRTVSSRGPCPSAVG